MARWLALALVLFAAARPARAQLYGCTDLDRVNRRLAGRVVDYTDNHGADRRTRLRRSWGCRATSTSISPPATTPGPPTRWSSTYMAYVDEYIFVGSGCS